MEIVFYKHYYLITNIPVLPKNTGVRILVEMGVIPRQAEKHEHHYVLTIDKSEYHKTAVIYIYVSDYKDRVVKRATNTQNFT